MRASFALVAVALLVPLAGCSDDPAKTPPSPPQTVTCPDGTVVTLQGDELSVDPCSDHQLPPPAPPEPAAPVWPHFPSDGASTKTFGEIESFDGHMIPVTIYQPKVADATHQVPILLHSHGFGGSRAKADDQFKEFIAAGFGIVSFDERGHGDARDDSVVEFMNPGFEVKDVIRVIDTIATWDWVLMDGPGDPHMGSIGGSYGGGFQLMTSIFDARLDALVPEITWNDIVDSLAPDGAIKSGWVDAFYGSGKALGTVSFSEDFDKGFLWATTSNMMPAGQIPGVVPDLVTPLRASSPAAYPGALKVPTLLIQGMPDTLFPLNQAVLNLRMLEAAGTPSALYTHLGGHILNSGSLFPNTLPTEIGLQPPPGGSPCGPKNDLAIAWHSHYLLGLDTWTGHPRVCLALDDETSVVGETFPLAATQSTTFEPPFTVELGGVGPVLQAPAGPDMRMNLLAADFDVIVAGIPHLSGTITVGGADAIVYFSLQVPEREGLAQILDAQAMPMRMAGPVTGIPFELDLGGVGARLKQGETLQLVASTVSPLFVANAERAPGVVSLEQLKLEVPLLPADTPGATPSSSP